jgi:hypothetical protein
MLKVRCSGQAAALTLLGLVAAPLATISAQRIPDRISDSEFWHLVTDLSEPGGYFRSENLLSNETGFQLVIPELTKTVQPGGVYFGVGPEQNFTYIVALHPRIAFIIDIRHRNAVHHLLYKALIEMSDNRADFLSRLFSRPRPAGLDTNSTIDSMFTAFNGVRPDSLYYYRTLADVKARLTRMHGFPLDSSEIKMLEENFDAFYWAGPGLSYNFNLGTSGGGFGGGRMPTYADLMTQVDNSGVHRSYIATEANYQTLRDIELRNMIVPLTGNFGGPKAIRAAGDYVRQHGATVTTFYASNVEQYLFQDGLWFEFAKSVATLPLDSTSTFIRSGGGFRGGGYGGGMRSSVLQSITDLLKQVTDGRIQGYQDVLATSH